ncbi:MAG: sulfurtransferase, partial [Pseudomonadota bacterium]
MNSLISAGWLEENLDQVVVLDASYYLAAMGKDADEEFTRAHIPGAQRWNIDEIADKSSSLKHMMPPPQVVAQAAGARGIDRQTQVVVYDQLGMFSAARVWLALRTIGHPHVALLDGGLPAWQAGTASGAADAVTPVVYEPFDSFALTVDRQVVLDALDATDAFILDARSAGRFNGVDPEPVAGLRSGHMPGALNVPYTLLLDANGLFKPVDELREIFTDTGLSGDERIISSCGSGVTACIVSFALHRIGIDSVVYDGSWSEWGQAEL